jgi:predicted RNA-binding protein (TIGR00451 family)
MCFVKSEIRNSLKTPEKAIPSKKSFAERQAEFSRSKLTMSVDYIFGRGTSKPLNKLELDYQYSRRTGRLKHVLSKTTKEILFSFRPNGSIAPSIKGFGILLSSNNLSHIRKRPRWAVTVVDGVTDIVSEGKTVFCKHVVHCSDELRAGEDVVILNEKSEILATGRSNLSGPVIKQFKRGAAVKVREGRRAKHATTDESRQ